ncbi:hypothetical protein VUR80DRAFT_10021 [Thermomyces stellatus]
MRDQPTEAVPAATMERHTKAVSLISAAVKGFFDKKVPYRINHGSTNSTRPLRRDRVASVDISSLSNVLEVNRAKLTALVEPNVPMDRLVEATLAEGLIPPIVMEFPGITAGGGFAGTAGESSSFKYGFFDDTVNEVEMVMANGDVVKANRTERADLFKGAAGAVGTLGITTLLELQLKVAKPFVRATYHRTHSVEEAIDTVRQQTRNPKNDYVDGILYSKDHGVVVTGVLAEEKPESQPAQTFSGAWDPWYYLHVADKTRTASNPVVDYIPLAEYLFRYDRGGFWVGRGAFDYFKVVPFSRFTRWFLDDFLHTRMMYRALHSSGESARFIVQDLALPYSTASDFVDYTSDSLNIWPLWLCPLRRPQAPTFHPRTTTPASAGLEREDEDMLNIGVWGWGPTDKAVFAAKNRELENRLRELGGMKWLYAHAYYSEDEFWDIYGRGWYESLREKYQATSLPSVYDKVNVNAKAASGESTGWKQWLKARWPVGGLYGISQSIKSGDYHLHRRAKWKHQGS